jgi:hypothetical protein
VNNFSEASKLLTAIPICSSFLGILLSNCQFFVQINEKLNYFDIWMLLLQFRTNLNNSKITNVRCGRFFWWEIRFLGTIPPHTHCRTQPETDSQQVRGVLLFSFSCTFLAFVSLVVPLVQRSIRYVLSGGRARYHPYLNQGTKQILPLLPN